MAKEASKPASQRAISLTAYLQRFIPYWGHPGWLEAARWRQLVRNQPIAIICRETLTENLLSMDWSINPKKSDDDSKETKDDINKKIFDLIIFEYVDSKPRTIYL